MKKSEKSKKSRAARAKRGYKKFERELKFKRDRNHNRALRKMKREIAAKQMDKFFSSIRDLRENGGEQPQPIISSDNQS